MRITLYLFVSFLCFQSCQVNNNVYNIIDYGAQGDSLSINSISIQKAIDACSKNGGGTVLIPEGVFVTGTIILKDNVTLEVTENAYLLGSSNPLDYLNIDAFIDATGQERGNCLIGSKGAKNIGIIGHGTIDGNGEAFLRKNLDVTLKTLNIDPEEHKNFGTNRPFLLRFVNSSNVQLKNINLKQSAAWACHFFQSNDIKIDSISIYNHAHRNNDGIDLDSSFDIIISNSHIDSEDDAICIKSTSPLPTYNVKVNNCKLKSDWGAIKFGTESMGDFYNISIKDCEIYETKGGGIKILSVDGANIHNVTIENIVMNTVDMPIFIRLGERLRTYREAEVQNVGSIKNLSIKNITATTQDLENSRVSPPAGIFITGTNKNKIGSVNLENISIKLPGGLDNLEILPVEELEKSYPEFTLFKVLPAYGLYARHVDSLQLNNITFETNQPDSREEMIFEDVTYYNQP